ncbi:hypothetical protein [Streptomyces sp. NBC_00986]|uniref:hypothetical protein n=1 Tax=Streptomyces sp. NBC_00986 TaxID=2903702 RepID=UPI0038665B37|nr:hypothetical protein OG504_39420 [Streptomyces sp. NBC_00986]
MAHAAMLRRRTLAAAQDVDLGVLYTTISAGILLARRYLTGRGIDQDFADRYGSAFGRTAAKAYRTTTGSEPRRAWSLVSGKWHRVNGYLPTEAAVLDEAYTTYPRTRDYVVTPEPAAEPSPVEISSEETNGCRLPSCDGSWHYDGTCVVQLGEIAFDGPDVALAAEVSVPVDTEPSIVAFEFNMSSLNTRREMRDQAAAREFVQNLRDFADSIDDWAEFLPVATG